MDGVSDDGLVRMVLAGEPRAFDLLVDRYWSRGLRFARRSLGNHADAEDAVQDAFVRAYGALGGYEPRGRFGGWFYRILVNECRATATRAARQQYEPLDEQAVGPAPGVVSDADALAAVDHSLALLEPLLREAFLLRYVEDMSYEQMREVTGAGESALRMRVKRARDLLRAHLANGVSPR